MFRLEVRNGIGTLDAPSKVPRQASLSITKSQSLLKLMSIKLVMPSNHLILCYPLLPSVFPSIRVFSNKSALRIRWPKYWSSSFSIIPSKEIPELEKRHVVPPSSQDEALAPYSVSREVPRSVLRRRETLVSLAFCRGP